MLLIILHNKEEFLEYFTKLALKKFISNSKIIRQKDIGRILMGSESDFILSNGKFSYKYNKAFIATIDNKKKLKDLLNLIEEDPYLNMINFHEQAFIFVLPIKNIEESKLMSSV